MSLGLTYSKIIVFLIISYVKCFYAFCNFLALDYLSETKLIDLYEFFTKPKHYSQKSLLWATSAQCQTVPLFLSLVFIFTVYTLWVVSDIFFSTYDPLPELQTVS